jgi:hypothetical protein
MSDESSPHKMAQAMVELAASMAPVIELAAGQRKLLESQGWSPTAAEAYALELLLGLTRLALSSGAK